MVDKKEYKKELKVFKAQRTRLLNKKVDSLYEFCKVQDRLNELDLLINELEEI